MVSVCLLSSPAWGPRYSRCFPRLDISLYLSKITLISWPLGTLGSVFFDASCSFLNIFHHSPNLTTPSSSTQLHPKPHTVSQASNISRVSFSLFCITRLKPFLPHSASSSPVQVLIELLFSSRTRSGYSSTVLGDFIFFPNNQLSITLTFKLLKSTVS